MNGAKHRRPARRQGPQGIGARLLDKAPLVGLLLGLAIVLYFPVSEGIDAWKRAQVVSQIDTAAAQVDTSKKDEILAQARAYNRKLAGLTPEDMSSDEVWPYDQQLSADGHDTAFGYVVIPKIGLKMPVFHGTSEEVLSAGVGHVEGSSLPVGGTTTHAVLSAHSGMAAKAAFDDIRLLEPGDVFGVVIMGDVYCYKVTGSEVVWPDELDSISIRDGEDLCTLVTCTPYGVNDHRLLVHAKRTKVPKGFLDEAPSPAAVLSSRRVWPALAGLAVAVALAAGALWRRRAKRNQGCPPTRAAHRARHGRVASHSKKDHGA